MRTKLDDQKFAYVSSFRMDQDHETMMALTLVGMQGIINRYQPSVYLDWNEIENEQASRFWVPLLGQHVDTVSLDLDGLSAVSFLVRRFGTWFSGAVIHNPEIPDVINLATMYAGLENRVMLAPKQVGLSGIPVFSSVLDLRPLATANAWDTSQAGRYRLYKWVYDTLWSRLERRIIAVISPGPPSSQPVGDGYNPFVMAGRDYIVALKLPALWLDPKDSLEADLFSKFLREAPSPIPVTGVFGGDEVVTTALVSRHGDWVAAIHWPNAPLSAGSLTAFSGVRPSIRRYQPPLDPARILASLHKKHIATLWCSDGDALHYQTNRGYHGGINWVWEQVQGYRFGWSMNPTLVDLAPVVWNYFVNSRRDVSLVCGWSGAGYMYPQLMSNEQLDAYLLKTETYLNESGMRAVWIWIDGRYGGWDRRMATQYHNRLRSAGLIGSFFGDAGPRWGLSVSYEGQPTPAVFPAYLLSSTNEQAIIDDILSRNPNEVLVNLTSSYLFVNFGRGQYVQDTDAMDGQAFKALAGNPKWDLVVGGPLATMPPGEYTVSYRLKVPDNVGTTDFAHVYVGRNIFQGTTFVDWMMIARRTLRQNDFNQPNKYQEYTVTFRLDTLLTNVEFRIDYSGAVTDLFVDYIRAARKDSLDFPVMAPVLISLVQPPQRLTESPQFVRNFENVGGLSLSPEEFLAVLNPEFMIEFAKPYLGSNHTSVVTAQNQLAQKDYIGSLITIWKALRPFIPSSVETISTQPQRFALHQNYPNPFNPSTAIQFSIPKASKVTLDIFNILGQKVAALLDGHLESGLHSVTWNPQNLSAGIYFYRLQTGKFVETKKLVLIR